MIVGSVHLTLCIQHTPSQLSNLLTYLLDVAVWLSGNVVGLINEVTLRRARLVLRLVTVRGCAVSVINQATQANSAWPSLRG